MTDVFILTSKERASTLGVSEVQVHSSPSSDTVVRLTSYLNFSVLANADHIFYYEDGKTKYLKCRTEEYQYSVDEVLILKLKATPVGKS